jgi:uncharacterized protein YkwD
MNCLASSPSVRCALWWPAIAVGLVLAACGGGSDDETSENADTEGGEAITGSPQPEPAYTSDFENPLGVVTNPTITVNCGLSNFAADALQRLNAYRAKGAFCGAYGTKAPTTPLAWDTGLIASTARHSYDMQKKNFTSHTGSDGSTPPLRMTQAGYSWSWWGENIGWGFGTTQQMVDWWMSSAVHCANIMNPKFKHVGLACVKGTSSNRWRTYWTMDLGAPR